MRPQSRAGSWQFRLAIHHFSLALEAMVAARIADQVDDFPTVRHGMAGKSRWRIGGEGDEIFDRQLDDFDQIDGKRSAELGQHLRLVTQGRELVILVLVPDPPVEFHVIGPVDESDVVVGKVAAEQERDVFGHGLEGIENAGRTGDELAQERRSRSPRRHD